MNHYAFAGMLAAFVVILAAAFIGTLPASNSYHPHKKDPLSAADAGNEHLDYINVDAVAWRAYLSHGMEFLVVDVENGNVPGKIGGFKGNHGIAPGPGLGRGFVSDVYAGQIVIVDLATFRKIAEAKGQREADAVLCDPASRRGFVSDGEPKNA